jgi:Tol biopolymer transport system component
LPSSADVTVPALMRADASDSVSPASVSATSRDGAPDATGLPLCADTTVAPRAAAAAAPRIVTVNARRERSVIGRKDRRFSRRTIGRIEAILDYPFPDSLVAAPTGSTIAWTFNERGVRNIHAADGPDFKARRVTPYKDDDGQELTNLTFSDDGKTIVYVRGGDHGANWPAEGNVMPNPTSSPVQPKMQIWAVAASGGAPRLLGEGDDPAIAPRTGRVAFVKDRRIWIAPIDGSKPAEMAFFAKGTSQSPAWSPDGRTPAFESVRDDHRFIGLFTSVDQPIHYLAPSTSRDVSPAWSPDGSSIAFIRLAGRGGVPRSPLVQRPGRHLFKVPVDAATPTPLTSGRGIEWIPAVTGDNRCLRGRRGHPRRPQRGSLREPRTRHQVGARRRRAHGCRSARWLSTTAPGSPREPSPVRLDRRPEA